MDFSERKLSCLLLHGLGGGPYELEPIASALRDQGIRTIEPVLPGHDGPGPIMPASEWQAWASKVSSCYEALAAEGSRVAVIGFSTGATLALNLAASKPVERMVLLAPFLEIRFTWMMPVRPETYLRPLARLLPHLPRRGPALRDRTARDSVAGQDRFRTFNLHASISALDLIEKVKPIINSITVPTLILQGKHDSVVEPRGAEWVYRNLGSTHKELIICTKSDHLVALDHDRDEVLARTLDFLLKPMTDHPA